MVEAQDEELWPSRDDQIEEWRRGLHAKARQHQSPEAEQVGQRARWELDEDAGDRDGRDKQADDRGRGAEMRGVQGCERAARHLVAEAAEEADGAQQHEGPGPPRRDVGRIRLALVGAVVRRRPILVRGCHGGLTLPGRGTASGRSAP